MNFMEWASMHPGLVFVLAVIVALTICTVVHRLVRMINILVRGWPPGNLDADGDQVGPGDHEVGSD